MDNFQVFRINKRNTITQICRCNIKVDNIGNFKSYFGVNK